MDVRFEAERRRDLGGSVGDALARSARRFGLAQLVDGEPDRPDDLVDVVDRLGDQPSKLRCGDSTLQTLQAEADTEELLDDGVVQVAGDAIVVLRECATPVGVGELLLMLHV